MVNYRRNRMPGGTYFFTATLLDRRSDRLVRHIHLLRDAWRAASRRVPHRTRAMVVLPDHLHALVTMHAGYDDYPTLWREFKKGFTRRVADLGIRLPRRGNEYALWQRRYWEHTIRDARDLQAHVDYIHYNPVKHGLVERPRDWPWSSFHRYVREGLLPIDWAHDPVNPGTGPQSEARPRP